MDTYLIFDLLTGRILSLHQGEYIEVAIAGLPEGKGLLQLESYPDTRVGYTHYIVGGELTTRPVMGAVVSGSEVLSNNRDSVSITGIPDTSKVTIIGPVSGQWEQEGATIDVSTDVPGHYQVIVECWPYQDLKVEFDAI